MKDTIYRDDAVALVIKAIHGTDNKEIQNYLLDGLRKQMWSIPSAENSNAKTQNSNQETQNSNGDLIYRADAIEAVGDWMQKEYGYLDLNRAERLIDALSALPSAEAVSREDALYERWVESEQAADYHIHKANASAEATDVYNAHEEEHLNIVNRIKELQYAIAKTQTIVGKMVESAEAEGSLKAIKRQIDEHWYLDAPSAEAVQGWIPCSERLPEIACRCLVTLSNNVVAVGMLHSEGEYENDLGYIVSWGKRWRLEPASMSIAYHEDSVTAWMPLPKPYKGGDSE